MIRDILHELRITAMLRLLIIACAVEQWASKEFKRLVFMRSADQVARMERDRGLI